MRNYIAILIALIVGSLFSCKNKGEENSTSKTTLGSNVTVDLVVDFKDRGIKIQPTMYGIFFEDINFAADGGLYAEMVKNRSFEFSNPDGEKNVTIILRSPIFDFKDSISGFAISNSPKDATWNQIFLSVGFISSLSILNEFFLTTKKLLPLTSIHF